LPPPKNKAGAKPWLDVQGGIALLFLKHYEKLSDAKLVENLSVNSNYQLFCGLVLQTHEQIRDLSLVSRWRSKLAHYLDKGLFQSCLQREWKSSIVHPHVHKQDATCYESYITYPTSVKLLWQGCIWAYHQLKLRCKAGKRTMPRSQFRQQRHKQRAYQLSKKPTHRQQIKRRKTLVYLLDKLITQLKEQGADSLKRADQQRLTTIETLLFQQRQHLQVPESKITHRIVSLHKPYLRPIVRGKENKSCEFGAKVQLYQVGNLDFIEHLSFEAFNESTRFQATIHHHQEHLHTAVKQVAADRIYATNANRSFCHRHQIHTSFDPKGRPCQDPLKRKQARQLRQVLTKERGTRLEGSFGNQKNHYLAAKIRARNQPNEELWIYLAVHTANASKVKNHFFA
jgi:transposase, IS5 family